MADPATISHQDLEDLPDEVAELIQPHVADDPNLLAEISKAIAEKRTEAKNHRMNSGIEDIWRECEEAYVGIDDANRGEFKNAKWTKSMSVDGPLTSDTKPVDSTKSTVFVRLTARYVDAGAAKLGEILLPADDKAFSFTETPVPDLIRAKEDMRQVVHDGMGNIPLTRPARPGEIPPQMPGVTANASALPAGMMAPPAPAQPQQPQDMRAGLPLPGVPQTPAGPPQVPLTVKDLAEEAIELARKKAKKAETRIDDWLTESLYRAECRKTIFDSARIGTGVLKGPFPKAKRGVVVQKDGDDGIEVQIEDRIFPATKWRDPWNIFPDPACGEDIHEGDFMLERDFLSPRQLKDLKKLPGYLAAQIDKVLTEGPAQAANDNNSGDAQKDKDKRKNRFEVWYYYGSLKREELSCIYAHAGKELTTKDVAEDKTDVYCIVTLVNDEVIKAAINPLDSGVFPYRVFPWQRRAGNWAGIGVGEQIRTPQRILNASTRSMLNNAGLSSGCQVILDISSVKPADGQWTFVPNKIWYKTGDTPGQDVRAAMEIFEIPSVTNEMMVIINNAMQMAEESTSIPLITQGQSGKTTPDTFGAAQLQDNNANQLLRSIGYSFDDYVTEPLIRDYYEYLLLDPDVPNDEKGDFQIDAHGSIALVERAIADQTITQLLAPSLNPAYRVDPAKTMALYLKSKRLNPKDVQYTDEQIAKLDAAPPPVAPAVQAAQVRAASAEKIAQGDQSLESQKAAASATVDLHELALKRELAMLEYANRERVSINDVKGQLAQTAMKLQTEKELNAANNAVDIHKHHNPAPAAEPPVQAPGRAAPGHAFDQSAAA